MPGNPAAPTFQDFVMLIKVSYNGINLRAHLGYLIQWVRFPVQPPNIWLPLERSEEELLGVEI